MSQSQPLHVLGITGSLRGASFNTALLRAAADLVPPEMTLEMIDLADLPMFNVDTEKPFPVAVAQFREKVAAADAVLISTPEYNSSISGALKNALDWASRKPQPPFADKPVAIMGASTGVFGTARAQMVLRQVLTHIGALVLPKPEVMVAKAQEAFDEDGKLINETTRGFLKDLLVALADWTRRVSD
jgi:chromate reductase